MNILIDNQPTIFVDILCNYLYSNRQFVKFYSSCKYFNNIIDNNVGVNKLFFTPKNSNELIKAITMYFTDKQMCYSTYGNIISWDTKYITNLLEIFTTLNRKYATELVMSKIINDWNISNSSLLDYQFYSSIFKKNNINLPVNYNNHINDYMDESNFGGSTFSYL